MHVHCVANKTRSNNRTPGLFPRPCIFPCVIEAAMPFKFFYLACYLVSKLQDWFLENKYKSTIAYDQIVPSSRQNYGPCGHEFNNFDRGLPPNLYARCPELEGILNIILIFTENSRSFWGEGPFLDNISMIENLLVAKIHDMRFNNNHPYLYMKIFCQ